MKKTAFNENYRHCCNETKLDFSNQAKIISAMYEDKEASRLMSFYLCLGATSGEAGSTTTIKTLADYGWRGSSQLTSLERKLLSTSGICSFCMLESNKIDATLEAMDLTENICPVHPRAVIQHTVSKIYFKEDGKLQVDHVDQNRMQCLFRHIRNSIAHGLTYEVSDDCLLLEDRGTKDKGRSVTARILVEKQSLIDWIDVIEKGPSKS